MIDSQGYRYNVGIIVVNRENRLLWAKRQGQTNAWQFPQGGVQQGESIQEAMYREMGEELGLSPDDVACIAVNRRWVFYTLPPHFRRHDRQPLCIGQKQRWFLLRLLTDDASIKIDQGELSEFDQWEWVDYWYPLDHVISFKRQVYTHVLNEFQHLILRKEAHPRC